MIRIDLDRLFYSEYFFNIFMNERPALDSGLILNDWLRGKVLTGEIYKWCEDNMDGIWSFYINNSSAMQFHLDHFYFGFALEEDAVAFKLRWL